MGGSNLCFAGRRLRPHGELPEHGLHLGVTRQEIKQTFLRFAIPLAWDFAEANPLAPNDRFYVGAVSNIGRVIQPLLNAVHDAPPPTVICTSATRELSGDFDVVVTDPPYYDAIGYSVLMDFFYVWLRRNLYGLSPEFDKVFRDQQHRNGIIRQTTESLSMTLADLTVIILAQKPLTKMGCSAPFSHAIMPLRPTGDS